jgi:uncharacterized protein YciI
MFIINLTYIIPLEEVEPFMDEHIAFITAQYDAGHFLMSGRKNPRTGGIILAKANSPEEIHRIMNQDPFIINKVASYDIIDFQPNRFATMFDGIKERL